MKKLVFLVSLLAAAMLSAQEINPIPQFWTWSGDHQVSFIYEMGRPSDSNFALDAATHKVVDAVVTPPMRFMPMMRGAGAPPMGPRIPGAENVRYSPDSTKMAFTRDNDLWVMDAASKKETRLTSDGSDVILNGYASWVYYEEILGRGSRYCAFWWSPDSKKIGFYRFDNTEVPFFPIYSPVAENADRSGLQIGFGQNAGGAVALEDMSPTGGSVRMT
ncbi:MAG: DPP IV N-terminal domain-containing protein, partial [Bacteroidales bacterium]|nr:DPP IV N-terminal domain-containing protein [Bacteroidales bacterium]